MYKDALKIATFSWESLHSVRIGGLARAVTDLTEALAEKGNEVHLFTRTDEGQPEYDLINGVHVHRVDFPQSFNIIELAQNMCSAMVDRFWKTRDVSGEFDIVHGHDWMTVDAIHELKNQGYPTVLTYHSTEYARNGGEFGDWWEFEEISSKEWSGTYVADKVTAVSSSLLDEIRWLYNVPEWKIEVVQNGGELGNYKRDIDPGEIKKRYGIHPLAPVVLFIGRLEYQKGIDLLAQAIPHILDHRPDTEFIIVGRGGMRDYIEQMVQDLGVSDSVRFLGYISDEEYKEVLNACDIVCIPSRNEPFGLVLFEAWDAEKAVVATDVGGLSENIENFENGIKVFTYPESIAWGINYIIDDPEGVRQLGKRGKEKLKKTTWSHIADKYIDVYKDLLST
ncbi:glycosyl transferase family 1 [candidate division MSBL1 archaeon SCGC-AAA259E19]|uniref:Glycosyl transferase family 1 n=1 Tax=candidate division MSBL1 archaeon SCGC-AAA259E19 TaxID=1698264 RepID=A0A133UL21_9EURY|nr:glycosyl transferase family 1 [candidate division MSBL1 archaeon SCGC-AAA259E19]